MVFHEVSSESKWWQEVATAVLGHLYPNHILLMTVVHTLEELTACRNKCVKNKCLELSLQVLAFVFPVYSERFILLARQVLIKGI